MAYCLLTGATGLVGRYLLRDLLAAGVPMAVVARPEKLLDARQRIEAVMTHWEAEERRPLPRPVVLEGDLVQPNLGLDAPQRRWVARNCGMVLHSAASMAFRPDEHGEPWRTNVDGMANLLELCRQTGIRQFHHISTAYICGLRTGRILETELDEGQRMGNVYETSKINAEKLLRAADGLGRVTIYRPASIVGDSRTGYSTNYHGFYLPLQLAYSFCARIPPKLMNERFLDLLGLNGDEGKNLVPVDWLSAAISYIFLHPEHHGTTYHLTSPKPAPVRLFQQVVQDAISRYSKRELATTVHPKVMSVFEKLYYEQMGVYRSHWRDDPIFDRTNSDRVLGHIPCPAMDYDLLMRVARYPIETNFAIRRHTRIDCPIEVAKHLGRYLQAGQYADNGAPPAERIVIQVNGRGGGQWRLLVRDGSVLGAEPGIGPNTSAGYYLNSDTFAALAQGQLTVEQSVNTGRVIIEGPRETHPNLMKILTKVTSPA